MKDVQVIKKKIPSTVNQHQSLRKFVVPYHCSVAPSFPGIQNLHQNQNQDSRVGTGLQWPVLHLTVFFPDLSPLQRHNRSTCGLIGKLSSNGFLQSNYPLVEVTFHFTNLMGFKAQQWWYLACWQKRALWKRVQVTQWQSYCLKQMDCENIWDVHKFVWLIVTCSWVSISEKDEDRRWTLSGICIQHFCSF